MALGAASLAAAAPAGRLGAQETRPLLPPSAFTLDQWTTQDGLPQNSVNAIAQDSEGYLWLGTFGGLVRFDGTRFRLVSRVDSAGRRHLDRVLALASGPDGSLWLGTQDAGLLHRHADGTYDVYTAADGLPDARIFSLRVTDGGDVWIGTDRPGLTRFGHGRFERLTEIGGASFGPSPFVVRGPGRRLWAYDGHRLVAVADGPDTVLRPRPAAASGLSRRLLLDDRAGAFWLAGDDEIFRLRGRSIRRYDIHNASAMAEDSEAGYWIGTTNDGLYHLRFRDADTPSVRRYALPDGRTSFRVRSMYSDRAGNVWIGTDANGLLRARRNLFTTYTSAEGLSHDVPTAVYGDAAGTMWVATNCGGVDAIDPDLRAVTIYNPRSPGDPRGDPCVFALTQTPDGTVWQGSYGGGLSVVAGGPERHVEGLPDSVVLALYTDSEGALWAGTRSGGLAAIEGGRVREVYTTADGLSSDAVRTIVQTRDGSLWIGTLEGADRLTDGRFTDTLADGLAVRAIHEDGDGNLWIGTYGAGLMVCLAARDACTPITRKDGLPDDVVSSILEDDAGNLWMSGNRGIYRATRSDLVALADGRRQHVHAVLYGAADGLRKPETNGGFEPAAWKDSRGRLWYPTVEGVAVVDPGRATVNLPPPPVTIEQVLVDGRPRPPADTIVVGPGRLNVELQYAALDLSNSGNVTFRHRLIGFDPGWVRSGHRRVAGYPRLPAGVYRFEVSAANRDGEWGNVPATMGLRVVPPLWGTWWFRLAGAAGLLGLLAAIVIRRERAALREQVARESFSRRLIESQERERRRVAGALHDGLGQQLLVIRNRALLALRGEGGDPDVRTQLREIETVTSESLESVRTLARTLTPRQLEHLGPTAALEDMIESVAASSGISIEAAVDPIDGLMTMEGEINLYRVAQEALNNVVRHSGAKTARVRVRRQNGAIVLAVDDDGRGFEADGAASAEGLGLSSMAERVRILDGSLEVDTAPGRGTRVVVSVPARGAWNAPDAP